MLDDLRDALHVSQRDDPLLPPLALRLAAFVDAHVNRDRFEAWIHLLDWTREGAMRFTRRDVGAQLASSDTGRLRLLLHVLEACDPARERVQAAVAAMCANTDAASLLAEAGMPLDHGFLGEAVSCVLTRVLPEPRDTKDLRQFVRRCYRNANHVARFERWPPELFHRLVEVIMPPADSPTWVTLRQSLVDAVHLLCVRMNSQGLSPRLRSRWTTAAKPVIESPFFSLGRAADDLLARWEPTPMVDGQPRAAIDPAAAEHAWFEALDACRSEHAELSRRMRGEGVSVGVGYSLDVLDRCLSRLEFLSQILVSPPGPERSALVQRLLTHLVRHLHDARSIRALATGNLRQLHRRIVERSARTAEHFIARGRRSYAHLLLAAAGGGILTVGTTAVKLAMSETHASDFVHGVMYGINYAVSFLLLHHLHLILATKHPAMTAATIATTLRDGRGSDRFDDIVDRMARICHSQIAAAAGNVTMVALGALAFTALWEMTLGRTFLDPVAAERTYESFSPLSSGTVFFAALTGVVLWLSAVAGGWLDNWSAWRRIPQGITDHPLGARLGRERLRRWGGIWQRHIGAWGSNISLGLMLGMLPSLGHFFGAPLDVRHVTLSTGMLFMACGSLQDDWYSTTWFLLAVSGIVTMFVLNLGVSFIVSLWTALRALEVPRDDMRELRRRFIARVIASPLDFILPAKGEKAEEEEGLPSSGGKAAVVQQAPSA